MDLDTNGAPRVRATGAGGLHVTTAAGLGTPWWRLVGDNGETLGHSESYESLSGAARGADAAERTVIRNAHRSGRALYDVLREMDAQDAKWGDQSHLPDATGPGTYPLEDLNYATSQDDTAAALAAHATEVTNELAQNATPTWRHVALEEIFEALAEESGSAGLYVELVQGAAVLTQWAAAVHRRYVDELTTAALAAAEGEQP